MKYLLPLLFLTLPLHAQDSTYYTKPDSVLLRENQQLRLDNQHLHAQNEKAKDVTSRFWSILLVIGLITIVTKL